MGDQLDKLLANSLAACCVAMFVYRFCFDVFWSCIVTMMVHFMTMLAIWATH